MAETPPLPWKLVSQTVDVVTEVAAILAGIPSILSQVDAVPAKIANGRAVRDVMPEFMPIAAHLAVIQTDLMTVLTDRARNSRLSEGYSCTHREGSCKCD